MQHLHVHNQSVAKTEGVSCKGAVRERRDRTKRGNAERCCRVVLGGQWSTPGAQQLDYSLRGRNRTEKRFRSQEEKRRNEKHEMEKTKDTCAPFQVNRLQGRIF